MKFRGKIVDPIAMRELLNVSNGLSKMSKVCVLRIVTRKIYFIVSDDDSGPKKPFIWCELPVDFYFKEYNLVGLSQEYNEIYLSFSTAMLATSLSTIKYNVVSLKIKLTNKQTPCLTLEIEQATDGTQNRQCVHDIPVELLLRQHWGDYAEPQFNDFHVSIKMPNLRLIKNIVERMKTMSQTIIVSASKHGRLTLRIKTNMVTLSAHFPDLSVESFAVGQTVLHDSDSEGEEVISHTVSAIVDVKKLLMFLSGMQLNNAKTICSIVHNRMVKFYLEQTGCLSLQYFLTQISL